jgi:RNA polymerase sigma factor (sigma-70 family)
MSDLALPIRSPPELALAGRLSSDERLAKLVSRGNARAFGLLYQRHHQALYRYCRSIVHNEDDAQDALQSAMLSALRALQAEERDLAVRPWLFRIVHNEAVSVLRRRRPDARLVEELEPSGQTVEHALEQSERIATLVVDLQALTERQRSAVVMRELSGLSTEEIAGALSISPGAAKQALFEARCALQEFTEGRAMECERVRRVLSDDDGRVMRGRKIRGHLRDCPGCRDFQGMIGERRAALHALAPPLPAAAASAILGRLLAHGINGGHAGGVGAASGLAVAKPAAVSLTAKALAGVAIVTVTAVGGARLASNHGSNASAPAAAAAVQTPSSPLGATDARTATKPGAGTSVASARRHGAARPAGAADTPSSGAQTISPAALSSSGSPLTGVVGRSNAKGHGTGSSAGGHSLHRRSALGAGESRRASPRGHHQAGAPARPGKPQPAKAPRHEPERGIAQSKRPIPGEFGKGNASQTQDQTSSAALPAASSEVASMP